MYTSIYEPMYAIKLKIKLLSRVWHINSLVESLTYRLWFVGLNCITLCSSMGLYTQSNEQDMFLPASCYGTIKRVYQTAMFLFPQIAVVLVCSALWILSIHAVLHNNRSSWQITYSSMSTNEHVEVCLLFWHVSLWWTERNLYLCLNPCWVLEY